MHREIRQELRETGGENDGMIMEIREFSRARPDA